VLIATAAAADQADLHCIAFSGRLESKLAISHRGSAMARSAVKIWLAIVVCFVVAVGARADDLYRAQAVVTGTGEPNRNEALGPGLEEVLIKVSGVQKLAGDARLAPYKAKAKDYVGSYSYHDQMSGIPIHDEQGTRDRPYDLTVDFDPAKIADVLKQLGVKPWAGKRPMIAVFAGLQQGNTSYVIAADGDRGSDQRDSLQAIAAKRGVPIVLPATADLAKSGIDGAKLAKAEPASLASLVADKGSEAVLVGQLVWNDHKLDWSAQWRFDSEGKTHRWQVRAPTYDEAFRRGIGGVAQLLSGNGEPK
jgi:hypothetical protein